MDLEVIKGMSFAEAQNMFIAKPLEPGKHTVVFREIDFSKAFIPKGSTIEVVPAVALVDGEEHTRTQNFTLQGIQILAKNVGQQHPELANQTLGGIIKALIDSAIVLDMWIVPNPKDGKLYYNWQFYAPIEVHEAEQNDSVANDLT